MEGHQGPPLMEVTWMARISAAIWAVITLLLLVIMGLPILLGIVVWAFINKERRTDE